MYRKQEDGGLDPTIIDNLCEIISVKKTDSTGKVREFYGIAQTKELGHLAELDMDELEELEARGIDVLFLSDGKSVAKDLREGRTPNYDAPANRIEKEGRSRTVRNLVNAFRKIGLIIPEDEKIVDKEPRLVLKGPATTELKRKKEPINKKYRVLVMEPRRYELSDINKTRFAKLYLSDYLLDLAKQKNGYFIGNFSAFDELNIHRLQDEAIRACQFATKNPGKVYGVDGLKGPLETQDLGTALDFIRKIDKTRTKLREERGLYGE